MFTQYMGAQQIKGSLILVKVEDATYGEMVEITTAHLSRKGVIVALEGDVAVVQVFEGTEGFSLENTRTSLVGTPLQIGLSESILGRTFDGLGRPMDQLGRIEAEVVRDINTPSINPLRRVYPRHFIQTGISAIDGLMTLVRGQKLPIFSANGLPHDKLAAQIVAQASGENYVVFAGIGLTHDTYQYFQNAFLESGTMDKLVSFLNLASSPVAERLVIPKVALTAAEYLAFDKGKDVLVVMTDMTAYCEALREVSVAKGEIPGRKGYPGYLYTELSNIYERAGMVSEKGGSMTLLPILTMPNDDITHPIPDLTGFITEGQIVLDRGLGFYPPINIMPSLSRLMKDGIGEQYTTADHGDIFKGVYHAYAKGNQARELSQIIGREGLSLADKKYLAFGEVLEQTVLTQGGRENRTIFQSLELARQALQVVADE